MIKKRTNVTKNNTQMEAFYECYEKHNEEYDWLSFFDIDEYLILKPKGIKNASIFRQ